LIPRLSTAIRGALDVGRRAIVGVRQEYETPTHYTVASAITLVGEGERRRGRNYALIAQLPPFRHALRFLYDEPDRHVQAMRGDI
jgi:hypothetical protein